MYVQINVVSLVLILIMLFNLKDQQESPDQKVFISILLACICLLFFDSLMWLLYGKIYPYSRQVLIFVTTMYFLFNPIICALWLFYCDCKINENLQGLKKRLGVYCIPFLCLSILIIASIWTGWIFTISETCHYIRGRLFYLVPILSFFYLIYAFVIALKKMRSASLKSQKQVYLYLILFPMFPLVGSIIQSLYYGVQLIWICCSLSLLIVFINIQNSQISLDALTGLYNRGYLDKYLAQKIQTITDEDSFFVILIDIDNFKRINDTYGHLEGDDALVAVSQLLKLACQINGDKLGRLGGDEFMIIGHRENRLLVENAMARIRLLVDEANLKKNRTYKLSLSMGYAIYMQDNARTVDDLMRIADKNMYNEKITKKSQKNQ